MRFGGGGDMSSSRPLEHASHMPSHFHNADVGVGAHDLGSLAQYISSQMDIMDDSSILHLPALATVPIQQRVVLVRQMRLAKAEQHQQLLALQRQQEMQQHFQQHPISQGAIPTQVLHGSDHNSNLSSPKSSPAVVMDTGVAGSPNRVPTPQPLLPPEDHHSSKPDEGSEVTSHTVLSDMNAGAKESQSSESHPLKTKAHGGAHAKKEVVDTSVAENASGKKASRKKKDVVESTGSVPLPSSESAAVKAAAMQSSNTSLPQQQEKSKSVAPWATRAETHDTAATQSKMTLKQIQELEQRDFKEREQRDIKEAQHFVQNLVLQEQSAAATGIPPQSNWANTSSPWKTGAAIKNATAKASGAATKTTLAEIMEDQSKLKSAEQARLTEMAVPTGKRYADSAASGISSSQSSGGGGGGAWGNSKVSAVIATGPILKPVLIPVSLSSANANHASSSDADGGAWNVVGKQASSSSASPRSALSHPGSNSPSHLQHAIVPVSEHVTKTPHQIATASLALIQWCRVALRGVQKTWSTVNVEEFISMLNSINIKESATITMICDDTLGGSTAIDPRKFADEYIRRRQAEAAGTPWSSTSAESSRHPNLAMAQPPPPPTAAQEPGWSTVTSSKNGPLVAPDSLSSFADENKFVVKTAGKKKKNKK
ncbi:hypothetical protein BASA83_008529 [Batrachochytrium salamandrivorans]|nr:hypothetical protein BASA83_008529 [Batrachochytrium salamandrivorans]